VSAQTLVYLYNQRQSVVLLEQQANPSRRYQTVYAKELMIHRGVDNLIEFAFINQEQKPVDITNKEITCRLISYNGSEVLLQKALVPLYAATGITTLQLSVADIEAIQAQKCYYSLEIPVGMFDYPVFVDSAGGARGVINVVNSVLPYHVSSNIVTVPSHLKPEPGVPRTYWSSVIDTRGYPDLTVQVFFEYFTGTIQYQASTVADFSSVYDLTTEYTYTANTGTEGFSIHGYHPYVRLKIVNNGTYPVNTFNQLSGDVVNILSR
jgi:hypothetical protein